MEQMSKSSNTVSPNRQSPNPFGRCTFRPRNEMPKQQEQKRKRKKKKIFSHKSIRIRGREGDEDKKLSFVSSSYITCSQKRYYTKTYSLLMI